MHLDMLSSWTRIAGQTANVVPNISLEYFNSSLRGLSVYLRGRVRSGCHALISNDYP